MPRPVVHRIAQELAEARNEFQLELRTARALHAVSRRS
jgi:hypothetical protein